MKVKTMMFVAILTLLVAFCFASDGQYHPIKNAPKAVNELGNAIADQQRNVVAAGGDEMNPGYSWADKSDFVTTHQLRTIVAEFKKTRTFKVGVVAVKQLSKEERRKVLRAFRRPIDPTWAETGQVGNGTTTAGEEVEEQIANALTSAIENASK